MAQQVARLIDPAQDAVLTCEDLHRHERITAFALEERVGAREVDVGRVAREDLVRRASAGQPHQSDLAPVWASSPAWASGGAEVAASVSSSAATRSVGTSVSGGAA